MKKEFICISCPVGCHLTAEENGDKITVTGNRCPRGEAYAVNELTNPKRMVTGVVKSNSEEVPFIPVRTSEPIGKRYIPDLLAELRKLKLTVPVVAGEVVLANFQGSGVDVTVTRSVSEQAV